MILSKEQMQRVIDGVIGYVPGCPDAAIKASVDSSTNDFIRDIGGIKEKFGPFPMNHVHGMIVLTAPFVGRVASVENVFACHGEVAKAAYSVITEEDGTAKVVISGVGIPRHAHGDFVTVLYSWFPGERTTQLPPQWFDAHVDALEHAAISHLASQIGRPWGNEAIAAMYRDEYAKNVSDCILESRRNENRGGAVSFFDKNEPWCFGF